MWMSQGGTLKPVPSRSTWNGRRLAESRLFVQGITAEGRHGANPGEQDTAQPFVVDVEVAVEVEGDTLQGTLDYRQLAAAASRVVSEESFHLLESLARAVAEQVARMKEVRSVTATVHKPRAAQSLGVDDVRASSTVAGEQPA